MKTTVQLIVLGLLAERPRHGYDIRRWLETSHAQDWTAVRPGSIYHALTQLESAGHIEVAGRDEAARGRTTYRITATGRDHLGQLLRDGWEAVGGVSPRDLYTLLTFGGELPADEQRTRLIALRERLAAELDALAEGRAAKGQAAQDELPGADRVLAMLDNAEAHVRADLALIDRVLEGS